MRRCNRKICKERTVRVFLYKVESFFHYHEMTVHFTVKHNFLFILIQIFRIITVSCTLTQISEEIIESLIYRTSLCAWTAKSPFTDTHCLIPFLLQYFSHSHLFFRKSQIEKAFRSLLSFIASNE